MSPANVFVEKSVQVKERIAQTNIWKNQKKTLAAVIDENWPKNIFANYYHNQELH